MSTVSNGPASGQDPIDPSTPRATPELVRVADEAVDAMSAIIDDEPVTSRRGEVFPPDPQSALAVRLTDGQLFLSLQDLPSSVDLTGRTVVSFVLLNDDETLFVKGAVVEGHDDITARLIGGLMRVG